MARDRKSTWAAEAYNNDFPTRPCIWPPPRPPVMMAARSFSTLETSPGRTVGISISSLSSPAWGSLRSPDVDGWWRTRLGCRCRALDIPPKPSESTDSRSLMRSGSSSAASWSPRSPASLQLENSDPSEREERREEKEDLVRSCFSWREPSGNVVRDQPSVGRCDEGRLRRGICAARAGVEEGIVKEFGLNGSSPTVLEGRRRDRGSRGGAIRSISAVADQRVERLRGGQIHRRMGDWCDRVTMA